jgi:hypothetical protein
MPSILELYQNYNIPPNLQEHQLRVAGVVAQLLSYLTIVGNLSVPVIQAAMLHDMGNILKFNLQSPNPFLADEELPSWQKVQKEYQRRYGQDVHEATQQIAREIGVAQNVLELIRAVDFHLLAEHVSENELPFLVIQYADMRVAPFGVTSLAERFLDGQQRYATLAQGRDLQTTFAAQTPLTESWPLLQQLERQVFTHCPKHKPEQITEESVGRFRHRLLRVVFP